MSVPRMRVPKTAKKGEVITIKTLIEHPMESGFRKGKDGKLVPRMIINKFTATFNGKQFFAADLQPSVSANPFIEFDAKVDADGTFEFTWVDDKGTITKAQAKITVTA